MSYLSDMGKPTGTRKTSFVAGPLSPSMRMDSRKHNRLPSSSVNTRLTTLPQQTSPGWSKLHTRFRELLGLLLLLIVVTGIWIMGIGQVLRSPWSYLSWSRSSKTKKVHPQGG